MAKQNNGRKWREVTLEDGDVWDKSGPLEGVMLKAERDVGPNKSMMYTVKTDKGEVKVWGSTVLDDKLLGVPQGTYIRLEYEGKQKSKKGTEYHSYKVFIDDNEPVLADEEDVPPEFLE